ncbi:MAG: hypothetical protein ACJAVX_001811 [Pseudoalteromonas rhizosphaerae]
MLDINSSDEIIVIKCPQKETSSPEYYTSKKQKNNIETKSVTILGNHNKFKTKKIPPNGGILTKAICL